MRNVRTLLLACAAGVALLFLLALCAGLVLVLEANSHVMGGGDSRLDRPTPSAACHVVSDRCVSCHWRTR